MSREMRKPMATTYSFTHGRYVDRDYLGAWDELNGTAEDGDPPDHVTIKAHGFRTAPPIGSVGIFSIDGTLFNAQVVAFEWESNGFFKVTFRSLGGDPAESDEPIIVEAR